MTKKSGLRKDDEAAAAKALKAHLTKVLKENHQQQIDIAAIASILQYQLSELEETALTEKVIQVRASRVMVTSRSGGVIRSNDGTWQPIHRIIRDDSGAYQFHMRTFHLADGTVRQYMCDELVQVKVSK